MATAEARERMERLSSEPFIDAHPTRPFVRGTFAAWREVWGRRALVVMLARREIRARYKDSALGVLWSLARPLAQLAVYYFAIGKLLELERAIPSFAIFVFIGLSTWTMFVEIVSKGTTSITSNSGLVKKVYLPREVFTLATTGGALFNYAVQLVVLLAAIALSRQIPGWEHLGYAAAGLVVIITFSLGLAFLLAAATVVARDLEHIVEVALIILFWASPIVYSYSFVERAVGGTILNEIYLANPVTVGILALQRGLWAAGADTATFPPDLGTSRCSWCGSASASSTASKASLRRCCDD
jgi:ABC-2 type transport system permease protein